MNTTQETTLHNNILEDSGEVPDVGELPYAYHLLPVLMKDDEKLASELVKNYGSSKDSKEEVLPWSKRFAVAIHHISALIYILISGSVRVAVVAGVSEAVRASQYPGAPVVVQSKDYNEHDYPECSPESLV